MGPGQVRRALRCADRTAAKPHRTAHATQLTHDGRPTGGNPVQRETLLAPPLDSWQQNKAKRAESPHHHPSSVLLSLYSPLPGALVRTTRRRRRREREGALALPCAPASPARVRVSRGPRLPCPPSSRSGRSARPTRGGAQRRVCVRSASTARRDREPMPCA